jgi:hypothetical protein
MELGASAKVDFGAIIHVDDVAALDNSVVAAGLRAL